MTDRQTPTDADPYDVVVVGAGICGIVFLRYARDHGLRCLVLDKQSDVGGLWRWLPAWQDIQNRREDFAINGVPLNGVRQPYILEHVREWVRQHDLAPFIKLHCEVTSVRWMGGRWQVQTSEGTVVAKHVVAASGVQNEPWVPAVERSRSGVVETHSSRLHHPEELAGRRVTVVGGGTSGWDLLDLAIEHGADDIHWVYRSVRWFLPTTRTKQGAWPNLRELAVVQSVVRSDNAVNAFLRWLLRTLYDWLHVTEIEPAEPFDVRTHQLIPGRALMRQNLDAICRHRGEVRAIRGREVTLDNGERFETDVLLWGTGYRMNLEYLDLPEFSQVATLDELRPKLGSLVRSIDHPSLFFIGMTLIDSTSATPFFAAIEAKSIVAHILGRCDIPTTNVPHHITHWDLFRQYARFDHANYPRGWWKIKYFLLAWWYAVLRNTSVRV